MMSSPLPPAPSGLGSQGGKLWQDMVGTYTFDPCELEVLTALARTVDELSRLDAEAAAGPVMTSGSRGQDTVNPIFAAVLAHRRSVEQLTRALALPVEGARAGGNPHRRAAVQTRWRRLDAVKARQA